VSNPLFLADSVPDPAWGLLAPLVVVIVRPRSHARNQSPGALNRRSERRSDRSVIARSIHRLSAWQMLGSQLSTSEGNSKGNSGGEHPLRARCSPSHALDFARIAVDANALRHPTAPANFNQRCELLDERLGRRPMPPDKCDAADDVINRSTAA
jgi:hypothetical protein